MVVVALVEVKGIVHKATVYVILGSGVSAMVWIGQGREQ